MHLNIFDDMLFDPFQLNEFDTDVHLFDIDPDLQYFNIKNYNDKFRKCTYYSEDSFNKKCYPLVKGINFLSLLHVNARSAPKNLDNYILFLQNINIDFSEEGVSETWLNDSNVDICNISGYTHVCNYRKGTRGGSVSLFLFLRQGIDYQTRDYLTLMNDYFESVFVQLSHESIKSTRDIIVSVTYRKPNTDVKSFVHE